ncbi:MAG: proton-conducting transporter membrane subunit [Actinomycetota bacterium]
MPRAVVPIALGVATITAALAVAVAFARPEIRFPFIAGAPAGLAVDGLAAFILPTVSIVTLLVLIFAAAEGVRAASRFHGLMLIFASAVAITVTSTTLPTLLFAWEIMGAASWALVGFAWREDSRVSAGLTAFITTRTGDLGLYLAAGAAIVGGSGLAFADLPDAATPWRNVIAAGILVAALGKAAQLPFSWWLSRAMAGPSPVSALLHSAAMVAMGGYLLLRVAPLLEATGWASTVTAWVGAITALALGAVAVAQRDLKQLLAASTSAQLGFVVLAAGVGSVSGGMTFLMAHAATKALLFLAAGAWLTALGTKRLSALRGVARRWPIVGVTFTVGILSLAGLAPLSLWAAKDELLAGALEISPALYIVGLAGAALSAAYSGKALFIVWRRVPADSETGYDTEQSGTRHVAGWTALPLVTLAVAAAVLGILALPPLAGSVGRILGGPSSAVPGILELAGSAVLVLAVLALVFWKGAPEPRWALNWLGLEQLTEALVLTPTVALSRALARFDDEILDRSIMISAQGVARGARSLTRFDTKGVDGTVEGLATQSRRLGRLARRPQTGKVHQYYAQITIVIGVLFILILVVR